MSRKKGLSKKEKAAKRYAEGRPSKYAEKHPTPQPSKQKEKSESVDGRF